jgi:hypothetical protein
MTRQLVFVHGRSQQGKDAARLKQIWIEAWKEGLGKHGLDMPIAEEEIRFPFYGDTLDDLTQGATPADAAKIVIKGDNADAQETQFIRSILLEVQRQAGVTDEQVQQLVAGPIERGVLNWEWVQNVLEAIDTYVPGASAASVALATRDVYKYLNHDGIRGIIDSGVGDAIIPGVETIVVGHSLGSVVSYNLLKNEGQAKGWVVPLYVTLGAPLAVNAIKEGLAPIKHPSCVGKWFNAMDEKDIVSLYPLDSDHFDIDPSIENKTDVDNPTENRHGIVGYLPDPVVARRIYDALIQ